MTGSFQFDTSGDFVHVGPPAATVWLRAIVKAAQPTNRREGAIGRRIGETPRGELAIHRARGHFPPRAKHQPVL